ncbi:hypothetical protein AAH995_24975 [Pseudomonas putida]|uniref:hypothetical protein n=1 Tax=Pseudomonas putida group TaxID=136845 RepID=UPI00349E8A2C
MGLRLTVQGADYSKLAPNFAAAVPGGLEYLNFFGGFKESLSRNLAPGGAPGVVVGNPQVGADSATFTQMQDYIQTLVKDSANKTVMAVGKSPSPPAQNILVSNYRGQRQNAGAGWENSTLGRTLTFAASTVEGTDNEQFFSTHWNGSTGASSTTVNSSISARPAGRVSCLVGRSNNAGGAIATEKTVRIDNKTDGLFKETKFSNAVFDLGAEFRIGGAYIVLSAASAQEVHFVAVWNRYLTDAEVESMYKQVSAYYRRRGIAL